MSGLSTTNWRGVICRTLFGVMILWLGPPLSAQELEIRRWNHLPIDQNFVTVYGRTDGDIAFDPVRRIEHAKVELDTWRLGYIRTFELFDKTARIEIRQAWQQGSWNGLIDGTPRLQGDLSRNLSLGEGWNPTANGERRTAGVVVTMQFKYNGGDQR
jgi:hypothetical protein